MSKPSKLKHLQITFEQVLENWYVSDTKENRIRLFNVFNRLVIHILGERFGVYGEKCYNYAFHYSLDLLDDFLQDYDHQRGVTGVEITEYVALSIKNYLREQKHVIEEDFFSDFEVFKNQKTPEEEMINYEIFSEINELLLLFFDERQIKRYLPLAISIIDSRNHSKISNLNDQNFKYFCMLLISLGKKLSKYYEKNVGTRNHSINELTVLISALNMPKMPQELVLACDLGSLDRLVEFAGGKSLRIPTREELEDAYEDIKDSVRYPSLQAKGEPLETNFGGQETTPTVNHTLSLFCNWLTQNKNKLSQVELDKISKILSQ